MGNELDRRENGPPARVYEAFEGEFLGTAVRYIEIQPGVRRMVVEDVIRVLGPSTFDGGFLSGRLSFIGDRVWVRSWSGTEMVRVGDIKAIDLVVLESNSPKASPFKKWVTDVIGEVQMTGSYNGVPAEFANDPMMMNIQVLQQLAVRQIETERRVKSVELQADRAIAIAESAELQVNRVVGWKRLNAFATQRGFDAEGIEKAIPSFFSKEGMRLSKICRSNGIEPIKSNDPNFPYVNLYPIAYLEGWLRETIRAYPQYNKKPWLNGL